MPIFIAADFDLSMSNDNGTSVFDHPASPLMKPHALKLTKQSPTPPPRATSPPLRFDSGDDTGQPHPPTYVQSPNDAYLLQYLDSRNSYVSNGDPRPWTPRHVDSEPEPGGSETEGQAPVRIKELPKLARLPDKGVAGQTPSSAAKPAQNDLETLAAKALAVSTPQSQLDCTLTTSTRKLSIQEGTSHRPKSISAHVNQYPSELPNRNVKSPQLLTPGSTGSAGLPPISPGGSEPAAQSLPPLRFHLEGMKLPLSDQDLTTRHHAPSSFTQSPPDAHQLPPMTVRHGSPQAPLSPPESYPRSLPSPFSAASPYASISNGGSHRPSADFGARPAAEALSHDPMPFVSSIVPSPVDDRMRIDGITNPQIGGYLCTFSGCNAPPFQTQYLLNSHANVHSSARPHYCPVSGCSRSEGGKGFKRKNEMIRHGLVHDSPGYICPFCPDRDHRYPRPDNLQRFDPNVPITTMLSGRELTKHFQGMSGCTMWTKARMIPSSVKSYPNALRVPIVAAEDAADLLDPVGCKTCGRPSVQANWHRSTSLDVPDLNKNTCHRHEVLVAMFFI